MEITTRQTNLRETLLIFSGRLKFNTRTELQRAFKKVQTKETKQVIFDLTNVTFIDCAILGILVQTKDEFSKKQILLSLLAIPGPVLDVLQSMQVDKILNIITAQKET